MNQSEIIFNGRHQGSGEYSGKEVEKEDAGYKEEKPHF
jgi:hypothetical protein